MLQRVLAPRDVIVCAAGSLPGDLHKLWRARDPKRLPPGVRLLLHGLRDRGAVSASRWPRPIGEVYVLVGDGSYLMMAQEIVTAVQEGFDHHRASRQSRLRQHRRAVRVGRQRRIRHALSVPRRGDAASSTATVLPVDLVANAESLGARAIWRARPARSSASALEDARATPTARRSSSSRSIASSASAATSHGGTCRSPRSAIDAVRTARTEYLRARAAERTYL